MANIKSRIKFKRATTASIAASADILLEGAPVFNTDTKELLVGNNTTPANSGILVKDAKNVTTQINGHNVADIFETDGVTTKMSKNAQKITTIDGVDSFVSVNEGFAARSLVLGGPKSTDFINVTKGVLVNSAYFQVHFLLHQSCF